LAFYRATNDRVSARPPFLLTLMIVRHLRIGIVTIGFLLLEANHAFAQQQPQQPQPPPEPTPEEQWPAPQTLPPGTRPMPTPEPPKPQTQVVVPAESEKRKDDLVAAPSEQPPAQGKIRFTADPVGDGAIIALGATFGFLTGAILDTNEIRPQQIDPNFSPNQLLGIDRAAIRQTIQPSANTLSNVGLGLAVTYAVADTVADIWREGKSAALVDAIMYAESFLVTQALTNVAKIAFRRPRPRAYMEREEFIRGGGSPAAYNNTEVDSALSFVSGHASQTASLCAAATYIAFSRSTTKSPPPWLTLAGAVLTTTFVSYERVRAGAHFPTDVIAGSALGTAVGALVVHLHREDTVKQRPVWIGATPILEGGMVTASGLF